MSTPESTSPPRRVPGQATLERLERRTKRRPKIGMSPEFYARFGLSDPWADTALEMQDDPRALFTYVDATRYRKMMRRLAFSRWRRERRARLFGQRRLGERTALRRAFPGEVKRSFGFGVRTLSSHDMIVPEKPEPEVVEVPAQGGRPRWQRNSMQSVANPWATTGGAPARSMTTARREGVSQDRSVGLRPTEALGARLAKTRAAKDPVLKAINAAMPRVDSATRRKVQRKLAQVEHLDEQTRAVEIRKVLRSIRRVQTVYEEQIIDAVPSALARPSEVARSRAKPALSRKRGLRPVLRRSPSMDVLNAPVPAADAPQAARKAPGTQRALARSTTKQVSGWARPSVVVSTTRSNAMLSASPVARSTRAVARSTARTVRTGASDTVTSKGRRTAAGETARSEALRTRRAPVVRTEAFNTVAGETEGARSSTTAVSSTQRSAAHRTASGETQGARAGRTVSGETAQSQAHRTASGTTQGARSGVTARGETQGARSGQTRAGETDSTTRSRTTASRPGTSAGVYVTAVGDTERSEARRTAGGETQGARVFGGSTVSDDTPDSSPRRAASAHAAARIPVEAPLAPAAPRAVSAQQQGRFVPAARLTHLEEAPAAASSHGAWAMERLERTGTSRTRKGSILPRMAPRAPESTYVVHADESLDVEALVAEIKRAAPGAQVRVTEKVSAWGPSSVSNAAARGTKAPLVSQAAAQSVQAARSVVQSSNDRVRRSKNPVSYARAPKQEALQLSVPQAAALASMGPAVQRVLGGTLPTQAVKTPDGVWIPAASFATPSAGSWASARAFLTGETRGAAAGSFRTGATQGAAASVFRTQGGQATGAQRFLGLSPSGGGAQTFLTPEARTTGAAGTALPGEAAPPRSGRRGPVAWAGARTQLTAQGQARGAERFRGGASSFLPGERMEGPGRTLQGAARNTGSTLEALAARESRSDAPSWAERSTRPTRVRSPGDLIEQLVQAQDVEQLVDLIVNRGGDLAPSMGLSKPVLQVIEQIRSVAKAEEEQSRSAGSGRRSGVGARASGRRRSAKVVRGFASLKGGSASFKSGVGPDKVMKLAGKLRGLIHLAEGGRMGDAQRQAKLAHGDRPEGRMEQGGDLSNSETAAKQSVDIEALAREVLEVVNREMELRQERRQEESDANVWW